MKQDLPIDTPMLIHYAFGILSPDLSKKVKSALEEDELLLMQYQGIIHLVQNNPGKDVEEILESLAKKVGQHPKVKQKIPGNKKTIPLWKPLALAASLLLLISTGWYWNKEFNAPGPQKLAATILEKPFERLPVSRGNTNGYSWTEDFNQNKFTEVVNTIASKDSSDLTESFVLGLCYMKLTPPQYPQAVQALHRATRSYEYQSDAWLYLGIAEILMGHNKDAVINLERSENPQARELLNLLNK